MIPVQDDMDSIDKFKANREKVDIIIMDMVMPKKSGREAYQEIIKLRSDVKVLFISGTARTCSRTGGFWTLGKMCLSSPFNHWILSGK